MSYLSASENVGFSGIPQNITEASCATQYKMGVESVTGACGNDGNPYINDTGGTEQSYLPHLNDNYFHTKFKIDPNELYTFHDSDIIASEITVAHTEDNYIYDNSNFKTQNGMDSPKEADVLCPVANGDIKIKPKKIVSNGHYTPVTKPAASNKKEVKPVTNKKDVTKAPKLAKSQITVKKEVDVKDISNVKLTNVKDPNPDVNTTTKSIATNSDSKVSISNVSKTATQSGPETFLDVFKRNLGLLDGGDKIKTEPGSDGKQPTQTTTPNSVSKKPGNLSSSKQQSTSKIRRGRGPTVHEALQRIPRRVIPRKNKEWHAPGHELFSCGPLNETCVNPYKQIDSSSDDDDLKPDFGQNIGCVEENLAESRSARLALRRAALRRQVARASAALRFVSSRHQERALATTIKKQLQQSSSNHLPLDTLNHLLVNQGMTSLFTSQERRRLRSTRSWSRGDILFTCPIPGCTSLVTPGGVQCSAHVSATSHAARQLWTSLTAPAHQNTTMTRTPISSKPKKTVRPRPKAVSPRRTKKRRRAACKPHSTPTHVVTSHQTLSEVHASACSNSSAYESGSEGIGALSDQEFIVNTTAPHPIEVCEVGQVPPDDILDPAVLSQIPDEAFTEFFNQAEGGAAFAESSELARALEAVLDERALDSLGECVATARNKLHVPASISMEMSSPAPS